MNKGATMMTLKLAWRNIWRNGRRTLITAAAIGLGVASLVFTQAMVEGMFSRMVGIATASMSGDAQVLAPGYRTTFDESLTLAEPAPLLAEARAIPGAAAAPRAFGQGLVAIGDRSQGVRVIGIDPAAERQVTNWAERLVDGRYLEPSTTVNDTAGGHDTALGEVMVGIDLARKLELELGTRLVLTMADIETGEARAEALRIVGFISTGDMMLDKQSAIVSLDLTQRMMGIGDGIHQVAIDLPGSTESQAVVDAAVAGLAKQGREVVAWHQINRVVAQAVEMQGFYLAIFIGIIFFIISFGIVNTLAMSLAERRHEFGVLRAIGTTPGRLGALVLTEAACLGLVGSVPGALLGVGLNLWLGQVGIDLSGTSQYGVTFTEPLYPVLDPIDPIWLSAVFTALTVLVAGVSAWRAARVEPVEAMQR